ncbi:MAG: radical SAM protein [Planctomycetota bacterium]|jgi:7-carboxy-7-deazaguanine synthase
MTESLIVNEIYRTLHGESSQAGWPCIIIRLTGCNLRCTWCDTTHAYDEGESVTVTDVLQRVTELTGRRVLVTGGEPLAQDAAVELLRRLCDAGYDTTLETNGSMDISPVDPRVRRIVDIKCPASGESDANRLENIDSLQPTDEVKFVIADRNDYEFARDLIAKHLTDLCSVIVSPAAGQVTAEQLAQWILDDGLDVRLGIQLHRVIWPNKERGV